MLRDRADAAEEGAGRGVPGEDVPEVAEGELVRTAADFLGA
ncbi:hypothetical protein [Streptomyces roseolus]|nr:hypothetical protein [Streptomyces roseolus]